MRERKLVPKKRFKGFEKNWDVITLEETSQKVGDGLHGTPKYDDSGSVYFINGNNIFNGKINFYKDTKTVTKYEQSSNDLLLDTHTILISVNGTIGNLAFYNGEEIMLGKSVAFIILKKNEKQYIFYYLQTPNVYNYFLNNLTGSTIKNLGLKQIKETKVALPVIKEQQKIGEFFKVLDERIANQERKIAKVKAIKDAYLTEMFPQEGETVPKRRFKGFEEEWKGIDLGSIGSTFSGLSGKTKKDFGHGSAEFVTYMNVFNNTISDINNTERVIHDNKETQLKYGDILFRTTSETTDEVGKSVVWLNDRPNVYLNSFCFGFRSNIKIDYYFVGYLLRANEFRRKIEILAQGISR